MSSFPLICFINFALILNILANYTLAEEHILSPIVKLKNGALLRGRVMEVEDQNFKQTKKPFKVYFYEGIKYGMFYGKIYLKTQIKQTYLYRKSCSF